MIVGMFTTLMKLFFFHWGGIPTLFLEWTPSTNANTFSHCFAHLEETFNISTANDSTAAMYSIARSMIMILHGGDKK